MSESDPRYLEINLTKDVDVGLGFSLLGKFAGIEPHSHIIFDVIEDSPAANEVSRKILLHCFFFFGRHSSFFM